MRVTVVDSAKLLQLLSAKGVRAQCPMCSHQAWDIPEHIQAEAFGVNIPWRHVDGGMYPTGIGCLPLICKNCGFLRLHDMKQYAEAFSVQDFGEESDERNEY